MAKASCTPATVFVKIDGAADAEAAMKLKAALTKNLPALLKVSMGMKGKLEGVIGSVKARSRALRRRSKAAAPRP